MSGIYEIPEEGLYISSQDPSIRYVVTEVFTDDEEDTEEDPFFSVTVVRKGDEDDMSAPSYHFDPDEWRDFVKANQLVFTSEDHMSLSDIRQLLSKAKS